MNIFYFLAFVACRSGDSAAPDEAQLFNTVEVQQSLGCFSRLAA